MIPIKTILNLMSFIGLSPECLEGAPIMTGAGKSVYDPLIVNDADALYLGDNALCPAAVGWIAALLGHLLDVPYPVVRVGDEGVEIWELGEGCPTHQWQWPREGWEDHDAALITEMTGHEPETDAARVAAVLLVEIRKVL